MKAPRFSIAAGLLAVLMMVSSVAHSAVTFSTATKNARMDAITTAIGTSGLLVIGTSALSGATGVLCTITLNSTAAASASSGVLTLSGFPKTCTASASGTAAKAELRTSGGTMVVGLSYGTSGTDIVGDSASFTSGQVYTHASQTLTHN